MTEKGRRRIAEIGLDRRAPSGQDMAGWCRGRCHADAETPVP
jgi:hypothetical protein